MLDAPDAWEWLRQLLATGTCALAIGLGEQVLRMTSAYTAKREQFVHPGRIGSGSPGALPAAGDVAVATI